MRTTAVYCRPLAGVPARGTENEGKGYRGPREERKDSPSRIDQGSRENQAGNCECSENETGNFAPREDTALRFSALTSRIRVSLEKGNSEEKVILNL